MKLTKCVVGKNEDGQQGWFIQFPYNKIFLEDDFKDAIDHLYREWNPATKTWWVSEECGGMLAGLFENWDMPITQPKNTMFMLGKKPKCPICNDKGLVPSTAIGVFSGKPIPNCLQPCECQEEIREYVRPLKPSDFDFSMSFSVYRSLCQYHGWDDPGPLEPSPIEEAKPQVIEHIYRTSDMGKKEFDLLQQTANKTNYLEKELKKHIVFSKKKKGRYLD